MLELYLNMYSTVTTYSKHVEFTKQSMRILERTELNCESRAREYTFLY